MLSTAVRLSVNSLRDFVRNLYSPDCNFLLCLLGRFPGSTRDFVKFFTILSAIAPRPIRTPPAIWPGPGQAAHKTIPTPCSKTPNALQTLFTVSLPGISWVIRTDKKPNAEISCRKTMTYPNESLSFYRHFRWSWGATVRSLEPKERVHHASRACPARMTATYQFD